MHPELIIPYNKWLISVEHKEHFTCKVCDYPIVADSKELHQLNAHKNKKDTTDF